MRPARCRHAGRARVSKGKCIGLDPATPQALGGIGEPASPEPQAKSEMQSRDYNEENQQLMQMQTDPAYLKAPVEDLPKNPVNFCRADQ